MFVLLRDAEAGCDTEAEFSNGEQTLRIKPALWNERVLHINTPGTQSSTAISGLQCENPV